MSKLDRNYNQTFCKDSECVYQLFYTVLQPAYLARVSALVHSANKYLKRVSSSVTVCYYRDALHFATKGKL